MSFWRNDSNILIILRDINEKVQVFKYLKEISMAGL